MREELYKQTCLYGTEPLTPEIKLCLIFTPFFEFCILFYK